MILIGIAGKSGSGKTTFSKYLEQHYSKITRIGVDDIVRSNGLIQKRNEIILGIINSTMNDEEINYLRQNYANEISVYVNKRIRLEEIKQTEIVIIDYALLYELKEIWDKLNYKILITRDESCTKKGLTNRNGKEHAEILAIVNEKICSNEEKFEFDYRIFNDDNIKKFYSDIENIVKDIFEKENIKDIF